MSYSLLSTRTISLFDLFGKMIPGNRFSKRMMCTCLLALAAIAGFAQDDEERCLKVKVRPTVDGTAIKGAAVKLYRGTQEETRIDTTKRKEVVFYLKRNDSYIIEVSAPGRAARRVSINTVIPDDVPRDMVFKCVMDIEMPPVELLQSEYYSDFPIAIIKFDSEKVRFGHIEEYTNIVRTRMEDGQNSEIIVSTPENTEQPAKIIAKTVESDQ